MEPERRYWFLAKRYGWGWSAPDTWQGWAVLILFLALTSIDVVFVLPRYGQLVFYVSLGILAACLILIVWRTGEPPRWRSGDE